MLLQVLSKCQSLASGINLASLRAAQLPLLFWKWDGMHPQIILLKYQILILWLDRLVFRICTLGNFNLYIYISNIFCISHWLRHRWSGDNFPLPGVGFRYSELKIRQFSSTPPPPQYWYFSKYWPSNLMLITDFALVLVFVNFCGRCMSVICKIVTWSDN